MHAIGALPHPGWLPEGLSSSMLSLVPLIHSVCPACSCTISCTTSAFLVQENSTFRLFVFPLYKFGFGIEDKEEAGREVRG